MASAEIGALRVVLGMNAGEFSRGMQAAEGDLQRFQRKLSKISDRINKVGVVLSASLTAPLAALGAVSLRAASDFEKGMSNVATLIDTNTESLSAMNAELLGIAKRTPVAIADLSSALYDVRSAGIAASDAMGVLEGSARLAVAGLGTTKEATGLVTSAINAFGLEGKEAENVYDTIFKTVKAGKTTIGELSQGFGAVAGTVANAGIKLDEYLASVAALTTTGLPAAQAHTQMRAAIAGLTRETEIGRKVFQALGAKDFKDLIQKSGGVVGAFKGIFNALQGNDAELIKLLGSVEAYGALIGLVDKQNESFNSTLGTMRSGVNAVDDAFKKQNSTIAATQQRMTNALESLGISIGTILTPAAEKLAQVLSGMAEAFSSLSPEMQSTLVIVGGLAAALGPLTLAVGLMTTGFAALLPAIAAVGAAIAGLIAASGPIGLFVITASAAVTAWNIFRDDIIAIFTRVQEVVAEKINAIVTRIQEMATTISTVFGHISAGEFTAALDAAFAETKKSIGGVTTVAKTVPGTLFKWATTMETVAQTFPAATVPIIDSINQVNAASRLLAQAERERMAIMMEMRTPEEEMIARQERLQELFGGSAAYAEVLGKANAKAAWIAQNAYANMASGVVSSLQQAFGESKALAIASALVNTYQSFTNAMANIPAPFNIPVAAAALASGLAQVANIRKTSKNGGGGSGASGGSGGGSSGGGQTTQAGVQQSLTVQGISADQMFSGDAVRGLAETLLDYQRDGGKVILA